MRNCVGGGTSKINTANTSYYFDNANKRFSFIVQISLVIATSAPFPSLDMPPNQHPVQGASSFCQHHHHRQQHRPPQKNRALRGFTQFASQPEYNHLVAVLTLRASALLVCYVHMEICIDGLISGTRIIIKMIKTIPNRLTDIYL